MAIILGAALGQIRIQDVKRHAAGFICNIRSCPATAMYSAGTAMSANNAG
jgi:hypothetical protein